MNEGNEKKFTFLVTIVIDLYREKQVIDQCD